MTRKEFDKILIEEGITSKRMRDELMKEKIFKGWIKRIICEYEDGSKEEITGQDLENFVDNLNRGSAMGSIHGPKFKPVKWKKIDREREIRS